MYRLSCWVLYLKEHIWIEAECGHKVDPIERWFEECGYCGSHTEPYDELESEPDVAHQFNVCKGLVRKGLWLVQSPIGHVSVGVGHSHIAYHGYPAVGVSLEAEREYRSQDEKHRNHGNYLEEQKMQSTPLQYRITWLRLWSMILGYIKLGLSVKDGPNLCQHFSPPIQKKVHYLLTWR